MNLGKFWPVVNDSGSGPLIFQLGGAAVSGVLGLGGSQNPSTPVFSRAGGKPLSLAMNNGFFRGDGTAFAQSPVVHGFNGYEFSLRFVLAMPALSDTGPWVAEPYQYQAADNNYLYIGWD